MINVFKFRPLIATLVGASMFVAPAVANDYREANVEVAVAKSAMTVKPTRAWNKLSIRPGKNAEIWTLDGDALNSVIFYSGIAAGSPLMKERNKSEPLPKMQKDMLLVDIPELLEGTVRSYNKIAIFSVTGSEPTKFLGRDAIRFNYAFTDTDQLPRLGEAVGTIIDGKLYLATFEAPRLHYFARTLDDYRALVSTASLK
jgi:hypothetical protein